MNAIIILNYCSYNDVINCIKSIDDNKITDVKIYIVDNKSPDKSGEHLCKYYEGRTDVQLIFNSKNNGYSAGNNIGLKYALKEKCKYIIIANPDVIFSTNSIRNMFNLFSEFKNIGLVGPKILNPDNTIYIYGQRKRKTGLSELYLLKYPISKLNLFRIKEKMFLSHDEFIKMRDVFTVSGCCFAISSVAAECLFPLDENIFMYMEESIIGERLKENNLRVVYNPSSEVIHNHLHIKRMISPFNLISKMTSEIYYIKKYLRGNLIKLMPILIYYSIVYIIGFFYSNEYRKMSMQFINALINIGD